MLRGDGFHTSSLWRRAVSRPLRFCKFSKIHLFFIPLNVSYFIANSCFCFVCLFFFHKLGTHLYDVLSFKIQFC